MDAEDLFIMQIQYCARDDCAIPGIMASGIELIFAEYSSLSTTRVKSFWSKMNTYVHEETGSPLV